MNPKPLFIQHDRARELLLELISSCYAGEVAREKRVEIWHGDWVFHT